MAENEILIPNQNSFYSKQQGLALLLLYLESQYRNKNLNLINDGTLFKLFSVIRQKSRNTKISLYYFIRIIRQCGIPQKELKFIHIPDEFVQKNYQ